MKITISGTPGSGKSAVATLVAQRLGLKHFSAGGFMREIAKKRGIDILELNMLAATDKSIDKEADDNVKRLGEEQDNFILDARLGWLFIPDSLKIFLEVAEEIGAERIFKQKRSDEQFDIEETAQAIKQRKEMEAKRYQETYGVDHLDKENYDFVLDTGNLSLREVVDKVVEFVENRNI